MRQRAGAAHRPRLRGAQRLLAKHRVTLDRFAQALLEKETLDRDELLTLFAELGPGVAGAKRWARVLPAANE